MTDEKHTMCKDELLASAEPTFITATGSNYEREPALRLAAETLLYTPVGRWGKEECDFLQMCIEKGLLEWIEEMNATRIRELRESPIVFQAAHAAAATKAEQKHKETRTAIKFSILLLLVGITLLLSTIFLACVPCAIGRTAIVFSMLFTVLFLFSLLLFIVNYSQIDSFIEESCVSDPFDKLFVNIMFDMKARKARTASLLLEEQRKKRIARRVALY